MTELSSFHCARGPCRQGGSRSDSGSLLSYSVNVAVLNWWPLITYSTLAPH